METVHLLNRKDGRTVIVFASLEAAEQRRDTLNADPFIAPGEPDTDAPYSVESWSVRE